MGTRSVHGIYIVTDYTQAEEDTYAATLSGVNEAYSVIIYNTTIPSVRYWDGSAFQSISQITADSIPLATATLPGGIPAFGATPALKIIRVNAAGTALEFVTLAGGGDMLKTDNLSGLANYVTARDNLGLEIGVDVPAINDARFTDARTPLPHSHPQSDVTNLVSDLAGKAAASHTHAESDVTNLVVDLAAKQPLDSDLTAIAALTPTNGDTILRIAGAWLNQTMAQLKTALGLVKGDVGLGSVDNTTDAGKPVSTAQQTALDLKANLASPTFTGTVSGITKTMVGLGNAENTTDLNKPVSTATQTALNTKPTIVYNQSIAAQGAGFAIDTYLVGSSILIPASSLKIGSRYHLVFNVNKTAAGTAAPIIIIRFGILGSVVDTARCTFTFSAQTAATDSGTFEIWATFRVVGGSAVLQGICQRRHGASITGLGTLVGETQTVTSGTFDSAVASSIIGVSVNGGLSAAWTVQLVQSKLENLV